MKTREYVSGARIAEVASDRLMADLRVLAIDMEQLLKATAGLGGEHVAHVRARAEDSLQAIKARVADLQEGALAKSRAAARAADDYVRANPWQVLGVCVVGGLVLGALLARGASADL